MSNPAEEEDLQNGDDVCLFPRSTSLALPRPYPPAISNTEMNRTRVESVLRRALLILAAAVCASCAAPPGSAMHKELGVNTGDGAAGVVFWVPEQLKGPVWLQFERVNARGTRTGVPISVHVESLVPAMDAALERRTLFRPHVMAFPLQAGEYVYSRWLAELDDGGTAVSGYVGWPFHVDEGELVHLGHFTLDVTIPKSGQLQYRITANEATPDDGALLQRHLDVLRAFPTRAAPVSRGKAVTGVATVSGSAFKTMESSTSLYIR